MSKMKKIIAAAIVGMALAVGITGCTGNDNAATPSLEIIPASADGAAVYQARCASCHGEDLRGTDMGPSQLSIVYEPNHHGDESYRSAIRNGAVEHHWGFGDMPVIDDITDDQVELVISFIREQQEILGFEG